MPYERGFVNVPDEGAEFRIVSLVIAPIRILEMVMSTQQERRDSKRVPCKLVCPFELTKFVDTKTVQLTKGSGHAINRSVGGMLLFLPEPVNKRQVVEIQASSKVKRRQRTILVEVCWTRPIPVSARVKMYLAGTRFLFELPAPGRSPQDH